jgi:predicted secreted protein
MKYLFGWEAALYLGAALVDDGNFSATTWTEVGEVRDAGPDIEAAEVDVTTRESARKGWRAWAPGLKDLTLDFELLLDKDDPNVEKLLDAFIDREEISAAMMDGDIEENGSQGPAGNFVVVQFSRQEDLEETVRYQVRLKPSSETDWYEVGAE